MSELLQRHTSYELAEQYVAEQYWPAGEAADTQRAIMIGLITRAGFTGSKDDIQQANRILDGLTGRADPAKAGKKKMTKEQIKMALSGFVKK